MFGKKHKTGKIEKVSLRRSQVGFAALWMLLIVFPAMLIFSHWVRTLTQDFAVRETAFTFIHEVKSQLASSGNYTRFIDGLRLRHGGHVTVSSMTDTQARLSLSVKSDNILIKDLDISIHKEPRTAIIFLDAGEYVAPIKQRHVNPEIWSLPQRVGPYQNFLPISSGRDRDSGRHHFVDKNLSADYYWLGPRFFLNLPSTMWREARSRVESRRYPDSAIDCVSWCANRPDCLIEYRDEDGRLHYHHPPSYCTDCALRFSCYGQGSRSECLRDAFIQCIQSSKRGLATWQGQSCSNPVFTAMKVLATNLWYYYAQDSRNYARIFTGPIDLSPNAGFGLNDRDRTYDIFTGRPSPLSRANGIVIQNAVDVERAIIDQDCVLALHRDSSAYISRLNSNNQPTPNEVHYFIHQPVPRSIRTRLDAGLATRYAHGIRVMPDPVLDSRGVLAENYYRRELTVPEAIFSQAAKQRQMGFNFLAVELADRLGSVPRNMPVDIFLILGDFPWFRLREHHDEPFAGEMDCMSSPPWVAGFLKLERTYDRAGDSNRHRLHLATVCPQNRYSAERAYTELLNRYLRIISDAVPPGVRATLYMIIPRSEGSFPSHGNEQYDCSGRVCTVLRDHVGIFSRILENSRRNFRNMDVIFIPVNKPSSLAHELSVFLPALIERSRTRVRIS